MTDIKRKESQAAQGLALFIDLEKQISQERRSRKLFTKPWIASYMHSCGWKAEILPTASTTHATIKNIKL